MAYEKIPLDADNIIAFSLPEPEGESSIRCKKEVRAVILRVHAKTTPKPRLWFLKIPSPFKPLKLLVRST